MKFTDRLFQNVRPIWEKSHSHPFVVGMGTGELPVESFVFYMKQDYVYLIDYAKLFAVGSMKAQDIETMGKFATLLEATLNGEMELHRRYAEKLGISRADLEATEPSPVTLAYTRYMLHIAQNGSLDELVSALLPCMWSYWEIGKHLAEKPGAADHPFYGEWIQMYSSPEFGELAQWLIGLMGRLAEGKPERELKVLEGHFITTSRYEYMFWDMAYKQEMWPI
jgi:thiaminase/transcriptional activator TenA